MWFHWPKHAFSTSPNVPWLHQRCTNRATSEKSVWQAPKSGYSWPSIWSTTLSWVCGGKMLVENCFRFEKSESLTANHSLPLKLANLVWVWSGSVWVLVVASLGMLELAEEYLELRIYAIGSVSQPWNFIMTQQTLKPFNLQKQSKLFCGLLFLNEHNEVFCQLEQLEVQAR